MTTKISAMTDGVTANAADVIPVVRSGANKYITPAYLLAYIDGLRGLIVRAHTTADLTVANSATTIINFDTVGRNPLSIVTTGVSWHATLPATGGYRIEIQQPFVDPNGSAYTAAKGCSIDLYKNGSFLANVGYEESDATAATNHWLFLTGSYGDAFTAADTIDLRLNNFSGATRKLSAGAQIAIYREY